MSTEDPLSYLEPAATRVRDPLSGRSVWLAGMIREARVDDGVLRFDLVFRPDHGRADRKSIEEALRVNLPAVGWDGDVSVNVRLEMPPQPSKPAGGGVVKVRPGGDRKDPVPGMSGPGVAPHGGPIRKQSLPGVRHIVAVASGKGGVGKSTVSTNLAVALARAGHRVGLMDADIYGPSLPTMMGTSARPMGSPDQKIIPVVAHGVRCMSMGFLMAPDQAVIWRGPMVMGAVRQFLQDTAWGELDYLIVDLPPGTGDAQLTLIQAVEIAGAVIVTTPQDVALADAIRGIAMFRKLDVPLLGLVENMAYYPLPDGSRDYVFGQDGGKRTAAEHGTDLLAQIPLQTALRQSGDAGSPAALRDDALGRSFADLAREVAERLPVDAV